MKNYYSVLENSPLFSGINRDEIQGLLGCLGGKASQFAKGAVILCEGTPATSFGIVLQGAVQMVRQDYYGNRSIVAHIGVGELFCESYACAGAAMFPISAVADDDSTVLLIDARRITVTCSNACSFHNRIIFNMLRLVADKNLVFDQKLQVLSKRSTKEKLMSYLLSQAKLHGCSSFTIPYDRQELADYLEVDRSGLSAQISKLRHAGVLESDKNHFVLLQGDE